MRVLIAGVGNILRGDDGFGIDVLHRLQQEIGCDGAIEFFESGIAGISLVQQLLDGYDSVVILDALDRGAEPGTVFVLEPDRQALCESGGSHDTIDLHQADPEGVLRLAARLGVLPKRVWIVGCQPECCDELRAGLSEPARAAVRLAVERVHEIVATLKVGSG